MSPDCKCCGGTANISGQVRGCLGTGLTAGATVTVVSGATGGPFSCDGSGNYTGTVTLTGSSASVVLSAAATTPNNVRFAAQTATLTMAVGNTYVQSFQLLANTSGYHCLPSALGCNYPVSNTLVGTDPTFGAFNLVYNANGGNLWSVAMNPAYTGIGACPSQASIAIGHDIGADGTWGTQYRGSGFGNDCPASSSANAWVSNINNILETNTITVTSCLPLSLSVSVNLAVGRRLRNIYGTGPITFTLTE
jgi:hypothetical protein